MTDRELLELAAKAAGMVNPAYIEMPTYSGINKGPSCRPWNPLTDDGDALRLAVALLLTVQQRDDHVKVGWQGCVEWIGETCLPCDAAHRPKATRRAIVRAVAAMGSKP